MHKISGFTLVEVLVAVALTGIILLTGYSTFQKIMEAQSRLGAAIDVQKNLFYTNEKLAALIREGGTIDYEEYFNRRMLGYARGRTDFNNDLFLDDLFTFTTASHFGNGNIDSKPPIYYCGFNNPPQGEEFCLGTNAVFDSAAAQPYSTATKTTIPVTTPPSTVGHQAYGQYEALAYNYLDLVGFPMPIKLPPIFKTTGGEQIKIFDRAAGVLVWKNPLDVGLPELYLIKKNIDNSYTRTYFRHVYVDDSFVTTPTCNPLNTVLDNPTDNISGCLGKIQMTKLEACDTFPDDGIIEAWIPHPDFRIGAVACPNSDAAIYTSAHEETMVSGSVPPNLTWVDVTAPDMNVVRATFLPNPLKIPAYMSGAGDSAQSPSVSVYLEVELSTKLRNKSFVRPEMNYPRTLITTYDLSE